MDKQHFDHDFSMKTALLMDKRHFTRDLSTKTGHFMDIDAHQMIS